jgi:ABC-type nickel/cobalt efflux system permease component RcnA
MRRPRRFRAFGAIRVCLLAALALAPLGVHADTVASLLGNFTVNQYCGLQLTSEVVNAHYAVVFGQLPALRELHLADTNGDGVTTQAERDAYAGYLAPILAQRLRLVIDGFSVPLRTQSWASSLPIEQGGFSLRLDVQFSAPLPGGEHATHRLSFANDNYPDEFGWNEMSVVSPASIAVFDSDAFSTSLTSALTAAVQSLPPNGPLAERSIHLSFTQGSAPVGSRLIQARTGGAPQLMAPTNTPAGGNGEQQWLQRQTRALVDLISAPHVAPHVTILALLIAMVLGAAHALSPGHGKTIVGAYLIGSRGTPRHALFLGITVTLTHTIGVFVLGFATLAASRFFVPERLLPILSLASGLLVLGMGIILFKQRWRAAQQQSQGFAHATAHHSHQLGHAHGDDGHAHHHHAHAAHTHEPHVHHDHHHHAHDDHGHSHDHDALLTHSHGGSAHSHLPREADGGQISWRSLLALGVSGGLVPCPSAMVLLLAAVALNKTAYGLLLVVAFSLGLAATLTLVGLMFLYARSRFRRRRQSSRWVQLLPVASAATITVIGVVLCVGAAQTLSVLR